MLIFRVCCIPQVDVSQQSLQLQWNNRSDEEKQTNIEDLFTISFIVTCTLEFAMMSVVNNVNNVPRARVKLTLPPVLREEEDFLFPLIVNM